MRRGLKTSRLRTKLLVALIPSVVFILILTGYITMWFSSKFLTEALRRNVQTQTAALAHEFETFLTQCKEDLLIISQRLSISQSSIASSDMVHFLEARKNVRGIAYSELGYISLKGEEHIFIIAGVNDVSVIPTADITMIRPSPLILFDHVKELKKGEVWVSDILEAVYPVNGLSNPAIPDSAVNTPTTPGPDLDNRLDKSIRAPSAGAGFNGEALASGPEGPTPRRLGDETIRHPASGIRHHSIILVDHGPPAEAGTCEADAFSAIGQHLHKKGVPVPRIYAYDRPSGLVALEDLGDLHLQALIRRTVNRAKVVAHYRAVIDLLVSMGIEGAKGFDPAYTYQTSHYDCNLILERESRYFVEAFLNRYIALGVNFEDLKEEFEVLAQNALKTSYNGFLHRDFQSRNILVRDHNYYLIDFQGGRLGPLQYDLASLLIDPYVALPHSLQETLLTYYVRRLADFVPVDPVDFIDAYKYCAINRNLQILGAFAFLSLEKGKKDFEEYIPPAISSLKALLHNVGQSECPKLLGIVQSL